MAEQTLIQIRVDTQLKDEVSDVFEKIGIDIPTAVRMYFKAVIREQRLPFDTSVGGVNQDAVKKKEAKKLMSCFKNMTIYEPPIQDAGDDDIILMPLEYGKIPISMYVQLVTKVPKGKITRWKDIFEYLSKLYGKEISEIPRKVFPLVDSDNNFLPYWRIVSSTGTLSDGLGGSRETQRKSLMKEGLSILQRGNMVGSYRVENYKEHMFQFDTLKVIKIE